MFQRRTGCEAQHSFEPARPATSRDVPLEVVSTGARARPLTRIPTALRGTIEPGKMNGQPCIRGMRLSVRRVLEALSTYASREELRADYPELEDEDIRQALAYAAAMLADETVVMPTTT